MDSFICRVIRTATVLIVITSSFLLLLSSFFKFSGNFDQSPVRTGAENGQISNNSEVNFGNPENDNSKTIASYPATAVSSNLEIDPKSDENYVAICMSVRNQSLDLPEFLAHHYHHLGIHHFYIQDDGTDPPLSTTTNHSIPSSAVTYTYYSKGSLPANQRFQPFAYEECNRKFGHKHTWIAYLDTDEFLEMTSISKTTGKRETLQDFLRTFDADETVGAVAANWKIHTSSSHLNRQSSVRKAYTTCISDRKKWDNRFVKAFVKTAKFKACDNPHWFHLEEGSRTVSEDGELIGPRREWRTPIRRDRVAVHHFATKSREEYEEKVERGNGMGDAKDWGWWEFLHAIRQVECGEMRWYAEEDERQGRI